MNSRYFVSFMKFVNFPFSYFFCIFVLYHSSIHLVSHILLFSFLTITLLNLSYQCLNLSPIIEVLQGIKVWVLHPFSIVDK